MQGESAQLAVAIDGGYLHAFLAPPTTVRGTVVLTTVADFQRRAQLSFWALTGGSRRCVWRQVVPLRVPATAGRPRIIVSAVAARHIDLIHIKVSAPGQRARRHTVRLRPVASGSRFRRKLAVFGALVLAGAASITVAMFGVGYPEAAPGIELPPPPPPSPTGPLAAGPLPATPKIERVRQLPAPVLASSVPQARGAAAPSQVGGTTPPISETIYFLPDSALLLDEQRQKLDALVQRLASGDVRSIELTGHAALFGTAEGRLSVSRQRAERVRSYLLERSGGGDDPRVRAVGAQLRASVREGDAPLNRRVEIVISLAEGPPAGARTRTEPQ